MRLWFNLLCRDIDAQLQFYQALLRLPEAPGTRSAIYRAVETEHFQLGFNAPEAYALLGLADRQPDAALPPPRSVTGYATFMLDTPDAVETASVKVTALGGKIIKPPYATPTTANGRRCWPTRKTTCSGSAQWERRATLLEAGRASPWPRPTPTAMG